MTKRVASRIESVQDPVIPMVGKMIAENPGTISLGQGVVHYRPPPEVFSCTTHSDNDFHRYGDVCGNVALLDLIREKLATDNSIQSEDESAVVFTAGSNMGFLNAVLAIADIEDEIILMSPFYFNHEMAIEIAGCKAVVVPTTEDYQLNLDSIRAAITDRTRAIVTVSPNNPTGAVYSRQALTEVNKLCVAHGIYHISDEAYEYFVYDDLRHFSPGSLEGAAAHTISLFTLSKAYGMAGWRAGYMVAPADLLMPIKKIQDTNLVCPPIISQAAAAAALQVGRAWCDPKAKALGQVRKAPLISTSST